VDFADAGALRHQDQPWKAAVVHQQQPAKAEIGHRKGVGGKLRIEFECVHTFKSISFFCFGDLLLQA
jgi:hypothetical protein